MTWDGTTIADVSGVDTYGTPPVPSVFTMSLGYTNQPTLPTMDIYFDNVQVQ